MMAAMIALGIKNTKITAAEHAKIDEMDMKKSLLLLLSIPHEIQNHLVKVERNFVRVAVVLYIRMPNFANNAVHI